MGILARATRNISRRKTRSLLVIVVLSFALAMLISIPPSITASKATTQKTVTNLTAIAKTVDSTINMVATQIDCHLPAISVPNAGPNNQTVIEQPLMNVTDYYTNLTSIPDVTNVIPIFDQTEFNGNFAFNVYGVPLDNASLLSTYSLLLPSNITFGRNLQAGDRGVVVLQERVANHFNIQVGGTVNILNQTFQVVGIEGYTPLNETAAYMNLNDAQAITNNVGNVTDFKVFADNVANVQSTANKIAVMYPQLSVSIAASLVDSVIQMQTQTNEELQMAQASMSQIQSTGTMEIVIVTAVVAAIVLFIMLYTVRERTREIGTLKALGASSWAILGQFMLEGILLSLIAGIVGIVIGTVGATSLANLLLPHPTQAGNSTVSTAGVSISSASSVSISVTITPELVLLGLGVAVLLGALGSLYPAWRAARTRPAEAMRYE
jgi:putative ABC transport system permease protein